MDRGLAADMSYRTSETFVVFFFLAIIYNDCGDPYNTSYIVMLFGHVTALS